ncbi:MAG: hypothetical protein WCI11_04810 [Candidatus Methylumidiphilus sp.]
MNGLIINSMIFLRSPFDKLSRNSFLWQENHELTDHQKFVKQRKAWLFLGNAMPRARGLLRSGRTEKSLIQQHWRGGGFMLLNDPGGQTALSFAHVERGTNWLR